MSGLQRRGTVSKSSGPTHLNSYALTGIPILYHAPSFVLDAQRLMTIRKQPSLPSQDMFTYNYTKERKVLEQSRVRTLSVIAEAEASKKWQEEEKARKDSQPRLPVLSSTILMPTPVAGSGSGSNSDGEATVPSSSSGNVNVTASLGQFIRDLEGVDDPFEIASLQAINDMEMLQTVLQPAVSSAVARPAVTSVAATHGQVQTVLPPANQTPAINQPLALINQAPAPVMSQHPAVSPVQTANPALIMNPGPVMNQSHVPPPVSQRPHQTAAHRTSSLLADSGVFVAVPSTSTSSPPTQISPTATVPLASAAAVAITNTNPFLSGSQAYSTSVSYSNPFIHRPHTTMSVAPGNGSANVGLPNPFIPIEASRTSPTLCTAPSAVLGSEPSVGTLIDIGAPQPTPSPPIAIPNTLPSYASVVSPASAPHIANQQPLPHPSSGLHNGPTVVGFSPQPGLTARSSSGPPPVPPKPHPHSHPTFTPISTGTVGDAAGVSGSDTVNPPLRPPKGFKPTSTTSVQSRAKELFANLPQLPNRPGLGIPVLPPIGNPTTSTAGSPNVQRSPPIPARRHTPPPPYYAEQEAERLSTRPQQAPVPRPRTYKLADPFPGMSAEEKAMVQSLSGMGFPGPRVARAVKKFGNDRTKTLDFLIAVGKLEDQGYSGDGVETALTAGGEDHNKAVDYLKRVNQYKNIGFPEKSIHEAYEKANKDWDQALDILTQERQ